VSWNLGAEIRDQLISERQLQRMAQPPRFDAYLGALVSGRAVQFTTADGTRRVLDEANAVRDWAPADAGLPGPEL
jgi:hypothetical protein